MFIGRYHIMTRAFVSEGVGTTVVLVRGPNMKNRILLVIMVGVLAGAIVLLANTPAEGG